MIARQHPQQSRRAVLRSAALGALSPLLAGRSARAQDRRRLVFVPVSDLAVLDPVFTPAYVTRNHGFLVFDTLYGADSAGRAQPQMVAGHSLDDDGRRWTFTLRDGLLFHDGTPVLARDAVASIRRWWSRDAFGAALEAATEELVAIDDKRFRLRTRQRFPTLLDGFAHCSLYLMPIMPERLATRPASAQVTEMVGSGPYRFVADERVTGARALYRRFAGYVPRQEAPDYLAGAKVPILEEIEWRTIPDPATASAALRRGEVDWWEQPTIDLVPQLRRAADVTVDVTDASGNLGALRLNHLHPPFDNPAIRRLVLTTVRQADYMTAVVGDDHALWQDNVGVFAPGSPIATDVGLAPMRGPVDYAAVRRELGSAGYKGERLVMLGATDYPVLNAMCEVAADMLRNMGFAVDYQATDWGTIVQRRVRQEPPDRGGWSALCTYTTGYDAQNPVTNTALNAVGRAGNFGWATSPQLVALRAAWLGAPDQAARQQVARDIQAQFVQDVPYVPLGDFQLPTAYRAGLRGIAKGSMMMFHNVRWAD